MDTTAPSCQKLSQTMLCLLTLARLKLSSPSCPSLQERVKDAQLFEITGLDYTGAVHLTDKQQDVKMYLCFFTVTIMHAAIKLFFTQASIADRLLAA